VTFAGEPAVILRGDLDAALESAPTGPGIYAIHAAAGEPHVGRTAVLRRRLKRLLGRRETQSHALSLRDVAERIEYWPASSTLEQTLVLYDVARRYLPERYAKLLRIRPPAFVRLALTNPFPRTHVTTRLGSAGDVYYGPFRTRAAAEEFEHALLDLFQLRRCQEDLEPSAGHPGCIYGEMSMCLRPCQLVVGAEEYASEGARVAEFLHHDGKRSLESAEHARERFSAELEFEAAARQHKRAEEIRAVLAIRDETARDVESVHGVAVLPSTSAGAVTLLFLIAGVWQCPREFDVPVNAQPSASMDHRLRELVSSLSPIKVRSHERIEHLAFFVRWYFSSYRDGVWIPFESLEKIPWRRWVSAISRVAANRA
jgi:excinuclease UvrABC nuclease subunit